MLDIRSSLPELFLRKGVLKICIRVTGEHSCRSAILIKLQSNFTEIWLWHGCSHVNLLHIFRTPFSKKTSVWLLLKNKAIEIDCLCCREVNECLLLQLKFWSQREASRHADFMGNCLTVSHTYLLYLPRWIFLFVPDVAEWNEHTGRIYTFFLVLIRWNEKKRWFQDFIPLPQKFESFPSDLLRARWLNLVYMCSVCRWLG